MHLPRHCCINSKAQAIAGSGSRADIVVLACHLAWPQRLSPVEDSIDDDCPVAICSIKRTNATVLSVEYACAYGRDSWPARGKGSGGGGGGVQCRGRLGKLTKKGDANWRPFVKSHGRCCSLGQPQQKRDVHRCAPHPPQAPQCLCKRGAP